MAAAKTTANPMSIRMVFSIVEAVYGNTHPADKIIRFPGKSVREFAASGKYDTKYIPYNWGLNDQGPHGRNYSRTKLMLDNIFK